MSDTRVRGFSAGFAERMDIALNKKGQSNATSTSRIAQPMIDADGHADSCTEDGASVSGRSVASHAPSLHPSVRTAYSAACSESTIGAGDETAYWDYRHRETFIKDLGHTCRECKRPFRKLGEALTERRGARTSMRYHAECFSGFADPRSQASSSMHAGKLAGTQLNAAPTQKAGSKMRTGAHFEGPSYKGGGRMASLFENSHNFGAQSAKLGNINSSVAPRREGLSTLQLEQHNLMMQQQYHSVEQPLLLSNNEGDAS